MRGENYRIAFFTNTYSPLVGGVSRSVKLFFEELRGRGMRVLIYTPEFSGTIQDPEEVRRITSLSNFYNSDFSLPMPVSSQVTADFREEYFDLVHVHHPFLLGEMGLQYARQERIPLVFTYHTQYERYTHYVPINEDTAARTILKHATEFCNMCDLVIAPTRDIKKQLRGRGVESKIVVLPSGIELDKYAQAHPENARATLGLDKDTPLLLYVGRLAKEKNLEYVFEAALKVLDQHPSATFVVVGSGALEEPLKARLNGGYGGRVLFTGPLEGAGLVDLYAAADVFLFASKTETQGMVLVESMAGATPVIALDADAVREVVKDKYNGRLIRGDASTDEFAEAVLEAIGDAKTRRQWQEEAVSTASAFDMPKLADRLLRHYRALKLLPRHELKNETTSFGLVRSYFSTIWQDVRDNLLQI